MFQFSAKDHRNATFKKAVAVAEQLLQNPGKEVLLHGDVHHKNILHCSKRGWLIIDPQPVRGEAVFDCGNVFYNPDDMPTLVENNQTILKRAQIFAEHFKVEAKRVLEYAFAFGCLSACWAVEDGKNPARRLRIVALIEQLISR